MSRVLVVFAVEIAQNSRKRSKVTPICTDYGILGTQLTPSGVSVHDEQYCLKMYWL